MEFVSFFFFFSEFFSLFFPENKEYNHNIQYIFFILNCSRHVVGGHVENSSSQNLSSCLVKDFSYRAPKSEDDFRFQTVCSFRTETVLDSVGVGPGTFLPHGLKANTW